MTALPLIGVGLKPDHYQQILTDQPNIDWFEVHSENFFTDGGIGLNKLLSIRKFYPISLHGIGLSLGSGDGLDRNHLMRLDHLIQELDPFLVSEHLSWSRVNKIFVPELLPVPYNQESLEIFCKNIDQAQSFLKREILIENPSSYMEYNLSTFSEQEFITILAQKTGAKILLDVNNVFVSCSNHGWNPLEYIAAIPPSLVREIHIAGHEVDDELNIRIDTHNNFVCEEVWDLYKIAQSKFSNCPVLLEWDSKIPTLDVLIEEALQARKYCQYTANT
jgi:uncharacterized protein